MFIQKSSRIPYQVLPMSDRERMKLKTNIHHFIMHNPKICKVAWNEREVMFFSYIQMAATYLAFTTRVWLTIDETQ